MVIQLVLDEIYEITIWEAITIDHLVSPSSTISWSFGVQGSLLTIAKLSTHDHKVKLVHKI